MAAGDFTASTSLVIQSLIDQHFGPGNQANAEFSRPFNTAAALTGEQTARIEPVMVAGTCIGWKVVWQKSGVETPTYSGSISGDTLNCDVPGTELESDSKTYTADKHVRYNTAINTGDCDNDIKANMRRMKALMKAMSICRTGFNTAAANFLDSEKQDNQDAGVTSIDRGNGAWVVNADGKTIELPSTDLTEVEALGYIDAVAANNDIENYFFVHGRANYFEMAFNSAFTRLNDNERNIFAALDNRRHYRDIRYLDQTLSTDNNSFVVNPDSLVFINKVVHQNVEAELISPKDGHWVFSIQDPL
jgi:hypothetical protein